MSVKPVYLIAAVAVVPVIVIFLPPLNKPDPALHTIVLNMEQFLFDPAVIVVNQGDVVVMKVTSSDVAHSLYLDSYDIHQKVEPGNAREIRFIADQPGKFQYRCSSTCGLFHPFMIGEFVVLPSLPFWQAAGFLFFLPLLFLGYLRYAERGSIYGKTQTSPATQAQRQPAG